MRSGTSGFGANISRNLRLDKDRCKAQSKRLVLASGWVFDQRNAVKGWLLISMNDHTEKTIRSVALRNPDLGDRLKQASRDTFAEIIDLAISEQVDALVLAGDIFDNG